MRLSLSDASGDGLRHAPNGVAPDGPITQRSHRQIGIATPDRLTCLDLAVGEVGVERLHDIAKEAAHAKGVRHFIEQHDCTAFGRELLDAAHARLVCPNYDLALDPFQRLEQTSHVGDCGNRVFDAGERG